MLERSLLGRSVTPLILLLSLSPLSHAAALRVTKAGSATPDGQTWATAYGSVQAAINAAAAGDEVWVAAGSFNESIRIPARKPVSLYGGFSGTESERSARSVGSSATTIAGAGGSTIVIHANGVTVDGFTITGGVGGGQAIWQYPDYSMEVIGSGIAVDGNNATIAHCLITSNTAGGWWMLETTYTPGGLGCGGGLAIYGSYATIQDNTIRGNSALGYTGMVSLGTEPWWYGGGAGGGILLKGNDALVQHNVIVGNLLPAYGDSGCTKVGGGIAVYAQRAVIRHNLIADHHLTAYSTQFIRGSYSEKNGSATGAGIYGPGETTRIIGNIIVRNSVDANATAQGGGVYGGVLIGNTIVDNAATLEGAAGVGGGAYTSDLCSSNLFAFNQGSSGVSGYNNLFFGQDSSGVGQNGNITGDPLFANRAGGDYNLLPGSPAIDAGEDSAFPFGDTDYEGRPRTLGGHADIGALEAPLPGGMANAGKALAVAAGFAPLASSDRASLDIVGGASADKVDLLDVVALLRRANGLDG
ncbi:MAG TPA: choice-of-anchor Q domain-containing protein [Armatimonadota bacterium]|jgi:hypothetical protein